MLKPESIKISQNDTTIQISLILAKAVDVEPEIDI